MLHTHRMFQIENNTLSFSYPYKQEAGQDTCFMCFVLLILSYQKRGDLLAYSDL